MKKHKWKINVHANEICRTIYHNQYDHYTVVFEAEEIIDVEDLVMVLIESQPEKFKRKNVREYILELLEKCK